MASSTLQLERAVPTYSEDVAVTVERSETTTLDVLYEHAVGTNVKLIEHDEQFDRINAKLAEHDQRFDRLEAKVDALLSHFGIEVEW